MKTPLFPSQSWVLLLSIIFFSGSTQAQNLVLNSGFEQGTVDWHLNSNFGEGTMELTSEYKHSDLKSLEINILEKEIHVPTQGSVISMSIRLQSGFKSVDNFRTSIGEVYCILRHKDIVFLKGNTYKGSVWLRSPNEIVVEFIFRRSGAHYDSPAIRKVVVGSDWQKVEITGGFEDDTEAFIGINFLTQGTLYVDDVSLTNITESITNQAAATLPVIDRAYFGIHLNELPHGNLHIWPQINAGTLRVWASATDWQSIHPSPDATNFERLDLFVQHRDAYSPASNIIYTFGYSPAWATEKGQLGSAPALHHWENFVREVGNRYKGKIKYYEMWNEHNYGEFWKGTSQEIFEMTKKAHEILKAIDPEIKILSPNVTIYGYRQLDEFLRLGGSQYVDIISFHNYQPKKPELSIPKIVAFKDLMNQHNIEYPLWNTEGNIGYSLDDPKPDSLRTNLSEDEAVAAISRSFIIQRLYGVTNFNVYCYEGSVMGPTYVQLSTARPSYTPTSASDAYLRTAQWLEGSTITSKAVDDGGNRWKVVLTNGSTTSWILWHTEGNSLYQVPSELQVERIEHLDAPDNILPGNNISIGIKPVLIHVVPNNRARTASPKEAMTLDKNTDEVNTRIQNYPNPFTGVTIINYYLNEDTNVELSVYDIYGRTVSALVNSKQQAGEHNVEFNSSANASCIYFVELKTDKKKLRLKIVSIQ